MLRRLVLSALGAGILLAGSPIGAAAYTVEPGDTLWAISRKTGVSVESLAQENQIVNPDRIYAGQEIKLPATGPPSRAEAQAILADAARNHGLRRSFVWAVAYWESGFNQQMVSAQGAVGLMQILPSTAAWAGPGLLGRKVELADAHDNAELGSALLRAYLEWFDDPKLALAAYYQGPSSARRDGVLASSRNYVEGVWALRNRFEASTQ